MRNFAKNYPDYSPQERKKDFQSLRSAFFFFLSLCGLDIVIVLIEFFYPNNQWIQRYHNHIFLGTIPIIMLLSLFVFNKLICIMKKNREFDSFVNQIKGDEKKFRVLFENSFDGHALCHSERGIIEFNDSFKAMLKLKDDTAYFLKEFVKENYRVEYCEYTDYKDFEEKALTGEYVSGFWVLEDQRGKNISVMMSLTKIVLQNDEYLLATLHDETTNEQRQNQLRKITAKAVQTTKAKSEFLANITHELRTPLNGIIGMSEELLLSLTDEQIKKEIEIINESGKSLLDLINNVLDFSKLDAHKINLESAPIESVSLFRQLEKSLRPLAERKNIFFHINLDQKIPTFFLGDRLRLSQILINLIGNAIKFTQRGGVTLKVKVLEQTQENDIKLKFSIEDSGIGIPAQDIPRLFNSFEQADSSTTRKFGGTGLGLSISRQIVELMGSQIKVESIVDKGSIFSFELITKESEIVHQEKTLFPSQESLVLSEKTLEKSILIAEDNKINQIVAEKYFTRLGFKHIDFAQTGKEALEKVLAQSYDYVFMDIQMPEMDGYEATEAIYDQVHFLDVPIIIAMTANNGAEDRKRSTNAGMLGFITKPLNINEIKDIILSFELKEHKDDVA